jgi:CRISPR-associated endonuclease Cas1
LKVFGGALEVTDGLGPVRRRRRYERATHQLARVLVLGATGIVTLDALRWLDALEIPLVVLDSETLKPTFSSVPRSADDARLRRALAFARVEPSGVEIARRLLGAKVTGEATNLRDRLDRPDFAAELARLAAILATAASIEEARGLEATAAAVYWQGWVDNPATRLRFVGSSRSRPPAHWLQFTTRRSVLGAASGNRGASTPANAVLNFLFALLEVETVIGCHALGLDASMAPIHADTRSRASLALDIMEATRPIVEAHVLAMIEARTFTRRNFHERQDGQVVLSPLLAAELAQTLPLWRAATGPWVEMVTHVLAEGIEGRYTATTPLTNAKSRAAAAEVRARYARRRNAQTPQTRQRPTRSATSNDYRCPDCGRPVTNPRHVRCEQCIGADPRQTPTLRQSRGRAISGRRQRKAEWAKASGSGTPVDPAWLIEVLRPALAGVTLRRVIEACSVTKSTASNWRTGRTNPHPMHWRVLAQVAGVRLPSGWSSQPADNLGSKKGASK